MSSPAGARAIGLIAGLVSFVVLFCLEGVLYYLLFGGQSGDAFSHFFILVGLAMIFIPLNIAVATLIGKRVSQEQRRKAQE